LAVVGVKPKEAAKVIRTIAGSFESHPSQLSIRVNVLDSRIVSSGPELASAQPETEAAEMRAAIDERVANSVAALRELAEAARARDATKCSELYARLDDLGFIPPFVIAVAGVCLEAAKLLPDSA
jgi:hypothetical protein